jgi:hypothetical protein
MVPLWTGTRGCMAQRAVRDQFSFINPSSTPGQAMSGTAICGGYGMNGQSGEF